MKLKTLIEDYLLKTKLYRTEGTYQYYSKVSRSLTRALEFTGLSEVDELDKNSQIKILLYFKEQTKKKNSQINADISFLYTILRHGNVKHRLTPFEKLPDDTTSFRAINDKVLIDLVNYLKTLNLRETNNLSWVLSIYLMLETGVRMTELLNIKTLNVDLISNSIILEKTKNGKNRVVFFDILSKDLLRTVVKQNNEYLIWNYNMDTRMRRHSLFHFFNQIADNVESSTKITAHRLRKTFATRLLKSGCPLTTIQKLLGHTDIRMTMKYLEIDAAMIEKDYFNFYPYQEYQKEKNNL